jgi:hypothetical protein
MAKGLMLDQKLAYWIREGARRSDVRELASKTKGMASALSLTPFHTSGHDDRNQTA